MAAQQYISPMARAAAAATKNPKPTIEITPTEWNTLVDGYISSKKDGTVAAQQYISPRARAPINPEIISRANALAKKLPRGITVRPSGKWQVQLYYLGKSRYIGVFESKNHAAIGYELARSCVASFGEESENEKQIKNNVQLMRKAAYSFIDDTAAAAKKPKPTIEITPTERNNCLPLSKSEASVVAEEGADTVGVREKEAAIDLFAMSKVNAKTYEEGHITSGSGGGSQETASASSIIAAHNARNSTPNKIYGKYIPRNAGTLNEMKMASDMMLASAGTDRDDPDAILHLRDDVTSSDEKDNSLSPVQKISIGAADICSPVAALLKLHRGGRSAVKEAKPESRTQPVVCRGRGRPKGSTKLPMAKRALDLSSAMVGIPNINKAAWTEAEMKILRDSQKVRPVVWLFYCPTYQS